MELKRNVEELLKFPLPVCTNWGFLKVNSPSRAWDTCEISLQKINCMHFTCDYVSDMCSCFEKCKNVNMISSEITHGNNVIHHHMPQKKSPEMKMMEKGKKNKRMKMCESQASFTCSKVKTKHYMYEVSHLHVQISHETIHQILIIYPSTAVLKCLYSYNLSNEIFHQ